MSLILLFKPKSVCAEPNDERTIWKRERDGKRNRNGKRKKDRKRDRDRNQIDSAQICNANKSIGSYEKWEITQFMHINAGKLV